MTIGWELGQFSCRLRSAAEKAAEINLSQDLSPVQVGLHDEIFQGKQPVLVGVDAHSTYCYLLSAAEHRDEDTWGWHLLELQRMGLDPEYTIADAAKGQGSRASGGLVGKTLSWRCLSPPTSV